MSRRTLLFAGLGTMVQIGVAGMGRAQTINADGGRILRAGMVESRLSGADRPVTPLWGLDQTVPAPMLRLRRGAEARIRLANDLPEPIALHWHGVRLANAMDGVPHLTQPPVAPGQSFDYRFTCPDAGTFWYHVSPWADRRGACGVLLVDDAAPAAVDHDVCLLIQGWRLLPDGTIAGPADVAKGAFHLTANGLPQVDIGVRRHARIRLRLVNAAGELMAITVERHPALVMALDGQPAEPFLARDSRVFLGPGNRADLFIDATLEGGASAAITAETQAGTVAIARLVYAGEPQRAAPLPDPPALPANPLPARMDFAGALRRDIVIDGADATGPTWPIRASMSEAIGRPLFSVRRGRTIMLAVANRTDAPVVLHVHGHAFRLLDRLDDGWKPFWLDTLVVPERQLLRIALVADNPGKWLIACGMLGWGPLSATWMATWFEVT